MTGTGDPFLEAAAMEWLRYGRQCPIVLRERGTRVGRPDVLAVNASGYLLEVEVKRTVADFRRDSQKPQRIDPKRYSSGVRQFYYLVPPGLSAKIMPLLPDGAGLLTIGRSTGYFGIPEIVVLRQASLRSWAKPVSPKRHQQLVKAMASHLVTAECRNRVLQESLKASQSRKSHPPCQGTASP